MIRRICALALVLFAGLAAARLPDLGLDMATTQQQTPERLAAFHETELEI